jgi:ferritin-like metal-binding protein YciE
MTTTRERLVSAVVAHLWRTEGHWPTLEDVLSYLRSQRIKREAAIQLIDESVLAGRVAFGEQEEEEEEDAAPSHPDDTSPEED